MDSKGFSSFLRFSEMRPFKVVLTAGAEVLIPRRGVVLRRAGGTPHYIYPPQKLLGSARFTGAAHFAPGVAERPRGYAPVYQRGLSTYVTGITWLDLCTWARCVSKHVPSVVTRVLGAVVTPLFINVV